MGRHRSNTIGVLLTGLIVLSCTAYSVDLLEVTKSVAAQGDATVQYHLGLMYADGEGAPQDDVEAVRLFRLAAEQEHDDARTSLGYRRFRFQENYNSLFLKDLFHNACTRYSSFHPFSRVL